MATSTIYYNSIRLAPGEQFTLPPGATLIGTELGDGSIDSTCDLGNSLEELQCYIARFSTVSNAQVGSDTIYFGPGEAKIEGFKLNGQSTSFAAPYTNTGVNINFTVPSLTAMGVELQTKIPGIIATAGSYTLSFGNDNGTLSYFLIKTIPSIATNLTMTYTTDVPSDGDNFKVVYDVEFVPYDYIVSGGYVDYPACL